MAWKIITLAQKFTERAKDFAAGLFHADAMDAKDRHRDEFKLLAGTAATIAGAVEMNPVFTGASAIPVYEAEQEVEAAGHKWRVAHGEAAAAASKGKSSGYSLAYLSKIPPMMP